MKKIDPKKEQELKKEVDTIYEFVDVLRQDATWTFEKIRELINKHSDKEVEEMSLKERKAMFKEMVTLFNRLRINSEDLLKADKKQEELRKKANEFYGEELLPPTEPLKLPSFDINNFKFPEENDEEWKEN